MQIKITLNEALQKASPSLRKKMEHTIAVIRRAEPLSLRYDADNGFYVGFSGGKDSQALYHMMQLCGVKMFAYFNPSSIDPPENIRFIRKYYPEVKFTPIKESIFTLFKRMKVLPSMRIRYCCSFYKESNGEGKVVCTGVRKAESVRRSKRNEIEVSGRKFSGHMDEFEDWQEKKIRKIMKHLNQDQFAEAKESEVRCISGHDKILLNPIIEWSEQDVWEFLNKVVEVPHCELYDQGWTRIGCICCPMANVKNTARDEKRWPYVKEKWIRAIMDVRKESILGNTPPSESERKLFTINGLCPTHRVPQMGKSIRPNGNGTTKILTGRSATARADIGGEYQRGGGTTINRNLGGATNIGKSTCPLKGLWTGKFLDSGNGESSAVVAEYDEEKERAIAEEIYDWWRSKKSFDQWFAEKFLQQTIDFDFDDDPDPDTH